MDLKIWLLFLLTEFIIEITPGPAVILVSAQGLKYGPRHSYFGVLGIITVSAVYFILSSLGLVALILSVRHILGFINFLGAVYLIATGMRMIWKSYKNTLQIVTENVKGTKCSKLFYQGVATEISNPKAAIFFMAVLPQFITTSKNIPLQFVILGITSIVIEAAALMVYGLIADKSKEAVKGNDKIAKIKDRLAGAALIGIGVRLCF